MKSRFGVVSRVLRGNSRTAVFAVTNRCNCRCIMCDMHRQPPRKIKFEDGKRIIDFLAANRFLVVYFTGGEPTLHPDLLEMVRYASGLGLITSLTTNGTSSIDTIKDLKKAGLDVISVSLDHWDPAVCENIRGYQNIQAKQEGVIRTCREIGLRVYALAYLNKLLVDDDIAKLVDFANNRLGAPFAFCYPTTSRANSFRLDSESRDAPDVESLKKAVATVLKMKKGKSRVANMGLYLEDVLKEPGERPNFYCRGGDAVIYVDWNGDVSPCFLKAKLFNILNDPKPAFLKHVKCNDCMINCFREPSLIPQVLLSPRLLWREGRYSRNVTETFV